MVVGILKSNAAGLASRPHTPPRTPRKAMNPSLSRAHSPPSRASSVHPFETTSPVRKVIKVLVEDDIEVIELPNDETSNTISDAELVYPESSEEPSSETEDDENDEDDEDDDDDDDQSDADDEDDDDEDEDDDDDVSSQCSDSSTSEIALELSGLRCSDKQELRFHETRQQRHREKRRDSRVYKRSHSISAKSESGNVDPDAMDDHDCPVAQRRLRRRTRGPGDFEFDLERLQANTIMRGGPVGLPPHVNRLVAVERL